MGKQHPLELFMPPNVLKAKVGGGGGKGLDLEAIERAEAAMETLKSNFSDWLISDIEKLEASHTSFTARRTQATRDTLFRASHDMKGQASTFEFPMIARIAGSLCKLIDEMPRFEDLPTGLIEAHVQAIHVLHKQKIKDTANTVATTLCSELEARVTEALAA